MANNNDLPCQKKAKVEDNVHHTENLAALMKIFIVAK
jgi:hypothetical protein